MGLGPALDRNSRIRGIQMHHHRIAAVLTVAAAALSSHAANWDRWRGPDNAGVAPGQAPTEWSSTENVKWVTEIPGYGHSTPVVWRNRVFLTTAVPTETVAEAAERQGLAADTTERLRELTGGRELRELSREERQRVNRELRRTVLAIPEHRFVVIALERSTGRKVWERTAVVATPHEGHHRRYGSFASSSPTTDGERIYVSFGSRGLYAYDLDGNLDWKKDYGVKLKMAGRFGEGRSPTVHGDTLLLVFDQQDDSFISALDKHTGEERWRRGRPERSAWSQPLITEYEGRMQAIVSASGKVRSYDMESGNLIWECAGLGSNVIPAVVRHGDMIYAMSGHRDPNLLAIRLGGRGDITGSEFVLWENQRGNSYTPSPVIHEGVLYFVSDRGLITALDARTGEPHYRQQRLPGSSSLKASPVGAGGKLYVATERGDVVVVRMGPEFEVLATNSIEDEIFIASPAIVDGEILLRGRDRLYCVGRGD